MGTPSTAVNFCQSPELVPTLREKAAVAYYTPVCIQGVREHALVDSGASVTMISENYACLMPNTWIKPLDGEFSSIEGVVQGSSLEMVGQLVVPIKLGKFISSNHRIVVVRGMKYSCILGMDFMERFFVSIDTTERKLVIKPPGGVITRVDVTPVFASERPQKVSALQRVEIPPRTMVRVRAKVNTSNWTGDGCIEAVEATSLEYLVPRTLQKVTNGQLLLDCVNYSDSFVVIQKKQNLGTFTPVESVNTVGLAENEVDNEVLSGDVSDLFELGALKLDKDQLALVKSY